MDEEVAPRWLRIGVHDSESMVALRLVGAGRAAGWADYGRWVALRGRMATLPGGVLDMRDAGQMAVVGRSLGLGRRALMAFLGRLHDAGAFEEDSWQSGQACDIEVFTSVQAYHARVRVNRENVRKRYGPRGADGS